MTIGAFFWVSCLYETLIICLRYRNLVFGHFRSCESVMDHCSSEALQMVRESAIDCFTVCGIGYIILTCLSFVITRVYARARRCGGIQR